jgi:beta-glucosidase
VRSYQFPEGFLWGTATSSYQIEGGIGEDGRGPSVWDTFSTTPGRTVNADTGAIACDHYRRYREDVKWMAELGVKDYRFSIAWPRIIPEGRGRVNEPGLDFYRRLVDCLRDHDITPHATLFHWDSPQALEDRYGSWRSRQMAQDFADYVTAVVSRLGDRISSWMTMNEIACFTHLGYGVNAVPVHAPGTVVDSLQQVWQASHHALLAHGLACQAIRAASPVPCTVALVDNFVPTIPLTETDSDVAAARAAFPLAGLNGSNGGIIAPALTGAYSPALLERLAGNAPDIRPDDMAIIHQPLDWLGLNLYFGTYVRATEHRAGHELLAFPAGYPRLNMPWLHFTPECIYWGIRHITDTLGRADLPLRITENGCAVEDARTDRGEIIDSDRILYLRQHLKSAHRAVQEGYPLQGYFLWTLLDNFEWAWGLSRRFGLLYTDHTTQQRIPKASFRWYRECIRQNRVV